jgi:purine catabolism regulator
VHGYLVVPDLLRGFDALDTAVSQQVGLAMALVLAQEYIAFEAESRLKSDLLRKLFSGTWSDPQEVVARAAFLGIDLAVPNALLLLRADMPVGGGDGAHVAGRIPGDQVLAQVAAVLASHFPGVAAVRDEQEVVILVPTDGKPDEFARVVAGALVELLAPLAPPALVVVGPVSSSVAEYPRARAECRRAVSVCQTLGKSGVIELSDLGAHRFLLSEDNIGAMQQFLEDTLGAILAYERKRPTELISTLWAYFDNNCSLRDTARALFIHVSTLRYRLERIETLSGLDLDDPETRFSLQLALRFHRLVESGIETAEPAVRRGAGSAPLAVRRPTG